MQRNGRGTGCGVEEKNKEENGKPRGLRSRLVQGARAPELGVIDFKWIEEDATDGAGRIRRVDAEMGGGALGRDKGVA